MRNSPNFIAFVIFSAIFAVTSTCEAQVERANDPNYLVDQAQHQVQAYLSKLADLRCTETVDQEKLTGNSHVEASAHSKYDYFLLMQGGTDDLQLSESRLELASTSPKHLPMLLTNGFSTLLLIFHPYYRSSFEFEVGAQESSTGHSLFPVHFKHIEGMRSPAALALRGREFPLELAGTAWIDWQSGQVVRMDASLMHEMTDVGLRSLKVHVDYNAVQIGMGGGKLTVPTSAVIELETPRQHWRNTHTFHDYKSFSIDTEQDPNVKLHVKEASIDGEGAKPGEATPVVQSASAAQTTGQKEKP